MTMAILPRWRAWADNGRDIGGPLAIVLFAPFFLLLFAIFVYPLGELLFISVTEPSLTLSNYARVLSNTTYGAILIRTLWISFVTTLAALFLGYPVAYLMTRVKNATLGLMMICVLLPFWSSILVRTAAWSVLLQREGLVNSLLAGLGMIHAPLRLLYTESAVLLAMTHVLLPFMILPLYGALRHIPTDYMRAAAVLGATRQRAFFHVLLPLSLPGVWSGSLMVFLTALGFFVTPALLGGPQQMMVATLISQQIRESLDWPFAAALVGVLTLLVMSVAVIFGKALSFDRLVGSAR